MCVNVGSAVRSPWWAIYADAWQGSIKCTTSIHSTMTHSSMSLSLSPHQTVSSSGQGCSESPVYTNLQELKISQTNVPPFPSGSPLHVLGDWETYKDQNGRHFYYNRSTQERTWKPPRAKDTSSGSSRGERHSTGESSEVQVMYRGCEEAHTYVHTLFYICRYEEVPVRAQKLLNCHMPVACEVSFCGEQVKM